uniref:Uncharacterized protein n=1 Tax=Oryza rufipogon TaxID=4529 RepID=A0A0E0PF14_ORYRU
MECGHMELDEAGEGRRRSQDLGRATMRRRRAVVDFRLRMGVARGSKLRTPMGLYQPLDRTVRLRLIDQLLLANCQRLSGDFGCSRGSESKTPNPQDLYQPFDQAVWLRFNGSPAITDSFSCGRDCHGLFGLGRMARPRRSGTSLLGESSVGVVGGAGAFRRNGTESSPPVKMSSTQFLCNFCEQTFDDLIWGVE